MESVASHYYLIRYKDLRGKPSKDYVYALDVEQARKLVMDFDSELQHHPGLINAILRVD